MGLSKRLFSWIFRILGIIFVLLGIILFFISSSALNITDSIDGVNSTIDNIVNETLSSQQSISVPYLLKFWIISDLEQNCEENPEQPICQSGRGQLPAEARLDILDKISTPFKNLINNLINEEVKSQLKFLRVTSIILWMLGTLFWLTGNNFRWRKFLIKAGATNGVMFFLFGALFYILKNKTTTDIIIFMQNTIPLNLSYEFLNMIANITISLIGNAIQSLYIIALVGFIISMIALVTGIVFFIIQYEKSKNVDVLKDTPFAK